MAVLALPDARRVVVYGSLAYDRVMDYPGRFRDALVPDKLHLINVSFAVPTLSENFGGTAGNISYNLALLGVRAQVLSSVGHDFAPYRAWLRQHGVALKVESAPRLKTAAAYIMTDRDDNQITAFHAGALQRPLRRLPRVQLSSALVVISPGNPKDMVRLAALCQARRTPYLFDPGQQIPALTAREVTACLRGAAAFIGNDYEVSLVAHKLKVSESKLRSQVPLLVRTLGPKGSELWHRGRRLRIPAVRPRRVIDPTGAGDAYRAGLVLGLVRGWPLRTAGRFASLVASYAVAQYGTQVHRFTLSQLTQHYAREFGERL